MPTRKRDDGWLAEQCRVTLSRLMPRLEARFAEGIDPAAWKAYTDRLKRYFPRLFNALLTLYGGRYDFFFHLEQILITATESWAARPDALKALDASRAADPQWFQSQRMVGAMCYVDLFADDLAGVRQKIPYLSEMGITFLHLMPPFRSPDGDDDGGYAISSYREIDPKLGTMADMAELATELRHYGISLCLDFVFNHTSDEHDWAKRALAGEEEFQNYYRMFPDRTEPDAYEQHLRVVFPDEHPGSFTYRNRIRKWVWTTFHNYQWDLNYENPQVFNAMAGEMLGLANVGVEVLRLDAVAFVWKRMGTDCENLPEAHTVIQAFNALVEIAAPAMLFLSEAIVHPDDVIKYIHREECQISYNPQLMALLWNTLATRDVRLLTRAMEKRFALPADCAWLNYVRSHDDIGWTFSDDDAHELGINPWDHRRFLNAFYTGRFEGSFARGLPFQDNPDTGDMRISGTCASLAGVEAAVNGGDEAELSLAIARILLIYGVVMTIGGIPLIYLGDELGVTNDYAYENDPALIGDSRWAHRPRFDWERAASRHDRTSVPGRIFLGLLRLLQIRQQNLAFTRADTEIVDTDNPHVFGYFRRHENQSMLVLANFSEREQILSARRLRTLGLRKTVTDILAGKIIVATEEMRLAPYQLAVLLAAA